MHPTSRLVVVSKNKVAFVLVVLIVTIVVVLFVVVVVFIVVVVVIVIILVDVVVLVEMPPPCHKGIQQQTPSLQEMHPITSKLSCVQGKNPWQRQQAPDYKQRQGPVERRT